MVWSLPIALCHFDLFDPRVWWNGGIRFIRDSKVTCDLFAFLDADLAALEKVQLKDSQAGV